MQGSTSSSSGSETIPYLQFSARDLPVPRFSKPQDIRGGNTKSIRSIAFSCDGKKVATGTEYKSVRIWNATQPMDVSGSYPLPKGSDSSPHNGHVAALAFSPVEPNILVSGCRSSAAGPIVVIWDITKPNAALKSFKLPGDILHIKFHPSGNHFAVTCTITSRDEAFFFWRSETDGEWAQRDDIGLGGSTGAVDSEEINSLRFNKSGKLLCAVSNDGSVNAWLYPAERVSRSPSPEIPPQTEEELGAEAEDTRDDDERKSRAVSPRDATPEETPKEDHQIEDAANEVKDEGEAAVSGETEEDAKPSTEDADVEMGESSNEKPATESQVPEAQESESTPGPSATNGDDVEMASSQPKLHDSTPASSAAPSRQPSPPRTKPRTVEKPKARPLKCVRHSICHSASLLSLSFDKAGRYMAIGGQDALLSLFDTRDWICQRTFDESTAAIRQSAFSPDGELIAIAGDDTFIIVASVYTKQTIAKITVTGAVLCLVWHPVENWLAYSTSKSGLVWYMVHQE